MSQGDIHAGHVPAATVFGFLPLDDFPLMSFAAAVEPLRAANVLAGRPVYGWRYVGLGGADSRASSGAAIRPDHRVGDDVGLDTLFVCAGGNPAAFRDERTFRWLRRLDRRGVRLGGISGGTYILARAGLLAGRRCTLHWEHVPAFAEEFPAIDLRRTLYEIDRDRFTCAGGIAALDLACEIIRRDHGARLARAVSEWFLQTRIRAGEAAQRMAVGERYGTGHPPLIRALEMLEAEADRTPSREALARGAGVSLRQLERLFAGALGTTIDRHALRIRLDRARDLVAQTTMPILEIAVACGFASASHFTRVYRARFGMPPGAARAAALGGRSGSRSAKNAGSADPRRE